MDETFTKSLIYTVEVEFLGWWEGIKDEVKGVRMVSHYTVHKGVSS